MDKPLFVASVFGPSEHNGMWYALQKRFLARTTQVPYDYRIILNGVAPAGFDPADVMIVNSENVRHGAALMQAVQHFREQRYDAYLLLDSDCFPVAAGWYDILREQMRRFGKSMASAVRTENLDLYPHPCACLMSNEVLVDPRLEFRQGVATKNLLGIDVIDTGGAMAGMAEVVLPLIRTNVVNVHPVAAAVYNHLFYHHGAGSRRFKFRVVDTYEYHSHWLPTDTRDSVAENLFLALKKDPDGFIGHLLGTERTILRRAARRFLSRL